MKVNRLRDFVERVGWTAVQASAGAGLTALTDDSLDWNTGLRFVGITTAIAVLKVITAQQVGSRGSGDAIPGGVEA